MMTMSTASSLTKPRLLQQMELVMEAWRPIPPSLVDLSFDPLTPGVVEQQLMNSETAFAALKLYTAAAGCYAPLLTAIQEFLSQLVSALHRELLGARAAADSSKGRAVASTLLLTAPPGSASTHDEEAALTAIDQRTEYAYKRIEDVEKRMVAVVDEAHERRKEFEAQVLSLQSEIKTLEEHLRDQTQKLRRALNDPDADRLLTREEFDRERKIISLERQLADEKRVVAERDATIEKQSAAIGSLKEVNGKYARQALELAARVRVYAEHNDKFATLLSMQYDEKLATDRENELLRKELVDLNQFHQLRDNLEGEGGTVTQSYELRAIRHGRGANVTVPRHLHFVGLLNRVAMAKEAAVTITADILVQRNSPSNQRYDLPAFIHAYMTKRHDRDAITWCYSLDEATQMFDSDVNLNLFGLVSRRILPESLYRDINIDQQIFVKGCELMDSLQHGSQTFTVPVPHVIGLLVEMYPGYTDSAFRKVCDHLSATLTSNGQAHYFMLFPNMEREAIHGAEASFASIDVRTENHFSQAFKELIVDDTGVTLQLLEDEIHKLILSHDRLGLSDLRNVTRTVFPSDGVAKEVMAMLKKAFLDHLGSSGNYEVSMPRSSFISLLRSKCPVRRGVYSTNITPDASKQRFKMLQAYAAGKGALGEVVLQSLVPIDYRDVLQSLTIHRTSFAVDPDDAGAAAHADGPDPLS